MQKRGTISLNRKAQVAMEYVMILSFALMILIPTIYVFREYVMESSDEIVINNVNRVARTLIDGSREIFYLGAPSKVIVDLEMPERVESMWLMDNSDEPMDAKTIEYFLMFKLNLQNGPEDFYFASEVPIKCEECKTNSNKDPIELNENCEKTIINQEDGTETKFKCYRFLEFNYSPGVKHFKIEADTCSGIGLCVFVGEVSTI